MARAAGTKIAYITEGVPYEVSPDSITTLARNNANPVFGWWCECCQEGHEPFWVNRKLADLVLQHHCRLRYHKTNAASPTRFK